MKSIMTCLPTKSSGIAAIVGLIVMSSTVSLRAEDLHLNTEHPELGLDQIAPKNEKREALQSANERLLAVESALLEELAEEKDSTLPAQEGPRAEARAVIKAPAAPKEVPPTEIAKGTNVNEALVKARLFSSATQEIADELESLQSKNTNLKNKMSRATGSLAEVREDNKILGMRAIRAEQELTSMQDEIKKMRNQLVLAETEVDRLSRILEDRNRKVLAEYRKSGSAGQPARAVKVTEEVIDEEVADNDEVRAGITTSVKTEAAGTDEMPIATVTVEKAHLRTGPGKDNSPLMSVSRGMRLVVEARQGEWYRVITPTGTRAWVASEVVAFGKDANSSPTRTVKVKGYDRGIEDEAFELISSSAR